MGFYTGDPSGSLAAASAPSYCVRGNWGGVASGAAPTRYCASESEVTVIADRIPRGKPPSRFRERSSSSLSQISSHLRVTQRVILATAVLTLTTGAALAAASGPAAAAATHSSDVRRACAATSNPGFAACMVLIRTDVKQRNEAQVSPQAPPNGYGPSSLQSAYKLPSSTAGTGQIVAVVDAYNDPDAVSNVATYRSTYGLPACNTTTKAGCLTVVNQNGAASPLPANSGSTGWATEESLDVDMVSAICPACHIYLVEADTPSFKNLGTAVNASVNVLHAGFVSNSYGGNDSTKNKTYDTDYYKHKGVAVTASAGDDGYQVNYPAASRDVTAVGG